MNPTLLAARWWLSRGVSVTPVQQRSKIAAIAWKPYQTRLPSLPEVDRWFSVPGTNLAVICGEVSGNLMVLDFDSMPTYRDWCEQQPRLHRSYTVETARGAHVYLYSQSCGHNIYTQGLDLKLSGYVLAPPSVHPSGHVYKVLHDGPILRAEWDEVVCDDWRQGAPYGRSITEYRKKQNPNPPLSSPLFDGDTAQLAATRSQARSEAVANVFVYTPRFAPVGRSAANNDSPIARIRAALPVVELLSKYTTPIPTSGDGRWWIMRCPFHHPDNHPSFWADALHNVCSCHVPECRAQQPGGRSMDVISCYARLRGISNREAIDELRREISNG
jgi:hypothetical protein